MKALLTAGTGAKSDRQRVIRELVGRGSITSQDELAGQLRARGYGVTQATVSRDIAELGLVKVARGDRHVYVSPADLAVPAPPSDDRLRQIVAQIPVQIGRSGLILLLVSAPGTAPVLAQAIDDSTMDEQEGTLAGDNTLLVLFRDEARLERWIARFRSIQGVPAPSAFPIGPGGRVAPAPASTEAPR
jgi:transcriptional regulator of arginine metabolism